MNSVQDIGKTMEMPILSRLGSCEVCDKNNAKYTCPNCEVKTCCLTCVKIHKREFNCSGVKNRVKYKPLKKFTDVDLHSDYVLLEDTNRLVENLIKKSRLFLRDKRLTGPNIKLIAAASKRGVQLQLLPPKFLRRKSNTTYLNWSTDSLFWKIEWFFPKANNLYICSKRELDTEKICDLLQNVLNSPSCNEQKNILKPYHGQNLNNLVVLLKAERKGGNCFHILDSSSTLRNALEGKVIIENPTFFVVLIEDIEDYHIVVPVSDNEEDDISPNRGSNFFF